MNDYFWTLVLLLGYIILSLLGRKKKRSATSGVSSPVDQALQQLLDFQHQTDDNAHTAPYPVTVEPEEPLPVASDPTTTDTTVVQPLRSHRERSDLSKHLQDPRFARRSFILSEIFGAPRSVRPPLRRPGQSGT